MKVLLVCHRLPYPPDHGARIRAYQLLRHLAGAHDVTLATLAHPDDDVAGVSELARWCRHIVVEPVGRVAGSVRALRRLLRGEPASFGYFDAPKLQRQLDALVRREKFDLAIAHSSSVAPYLESFDGPKILDFCDMDSQKWLAFAAHQRWPWSRLYALEGRRLEREERRLAGLFDAIGVATPGEWHDARRICGPVRGRHFPIGVDPRRFRPDFAAAEPEVLCFLGRMDYYPNAAAVRRFVADSWPLIRARRPRATLLVIGASPPASIRRLHGHAGIVVTGTVNDVRPLAQRAVIGIAPMTIARGTQNKILESMAMGLAVVTTSIAAGGVDAVAGEHLLVADGSREFAEAVLGLLDDDDRRRQLAVAGRSRVVSHHDPATCLSGLDELMVEVVRA